jgi:histidyl-tRNA synthetase
MQVPGLSLRVGSIGSIDSRAEYRKELQAFLREHEADISKDVRERIDENPLRAFDAKDEDTRAVMAKAPTMLERLDGKDAEHFAELKSLLKRAGVRFSLDPTLVRGLDYYTRTVFAFESDNLGAQSEIAGGGRYDGLMELLGGPPTPGVGWACGIERLLMALNAPGGPPRVEVFVVAPEAHRDAALGLVFELRRNQIATDLDLAGRSIKGQMKQADRAGADIALILEEDGTAQARDMETGEQREIALDRVVAELSR